MGFFYFVGEGGGELDGCGEAVGVVLGEDDGVDCAASLLREDAVALLVGFDTAGGVDGFSVHFEPSAEAFEAVVDGRVEFAVAIGADAHEVVASAGDDAAEVVDQRADAFEVVVGGPGPGGAHGHAGFPGVVQVVGGDLAFGGDVVLVGAGDGAVYDDEAGLVFAGHGGEAVHVDVRVGGSDGAAVQPENVLAAVPGHELFDLGPGVVLEFLPGLGVLGGVVVGSLSGAGAELGEPVVGAVPIGLAEVKTRDEAVLAKGGGHGLDGVGARVVVEGDAVGGDFVVGLLGVPHGEAIVVLGHGEDVSHARVFEGFGPLVGIEVGGVEGVGKVFVDFLVGAVVEVLVLGGALVPGVASGDEAPRFDDSPLAVGPPVDENAELLVLPPLEVFEDGGVGGGRVVGGLGGYKEG